nr:extracellular solute-binding protein [uncultured Dysosmobacter sp.]
MKSKKLIALILSMLMLLSLLAGCGGKDSGSQDAAPVDPDRDYANDPNWFGTDDGQPVTLRFWCGIQPEYGYQQMVDNFNAEYADKGVQVEYNRYVNNADGNLQLDTYLMGKDGVDVFIGYGNKNALITRGESGMLYDYSDYLETIGFDVEKELGEKSAVEYVLEDGTVWGLPTKFDNKGYLMINKDAFEKAGLEIPYEGWTFEEFKVACEKLTSGEGMEKKYGICWGFDFNHRASLDYISSALGVNRYFKDASMQETNLDSPVWADGIQLMKDTIDNGWATSLQDDIADKMTVQTVFLTEKTAMFAIFSQLRLAMDTENYPHEFTTALVPFPVPSEEYAEFKDQASESYSGDFISIASGCKNVEAACEFVRWYIQGGMNPVIMAARYPLWTGNDVQDILDIVVEESQGTIDTTSLEHLFSADRSSFTEPSYVNDNESAIRDIIWEEVQNFLYGRTSSAQEAMAIAKERADALLK